MMSIRFKIWKRLITEQTPLSSRHVSKAMSQLSSLPIYAKPHLKFLTFCTETTPPSTFPPDRGVVKEFFLSKCRLTEEEITKAFKSRNDLLRFDSAQNCEEVLELLNGCGLSTPAQIRRVILRHPQFFFYRSERNIKPKLSFLRTFMKEEDIAKLIYSDARFITLRGYRIKSAVSLLRKLGFDSEAISELLASQPHFLRASEKDVTESFKNAEDWGFKNGSKVFLRAMRHTLGVRKEKLDRRRLCFGSLGFSEKQISDMLRQQPSVLSLSEEKVKRNWDFLVNLGFSEKQISDMLRRQPSVLALSEEKVKRNWDFLVNSVGLSLDDLVKYPPMFAYSLEKRMIPRYRVMKELESMQLLKRKVSFPTLCTMPERIFLEKYIHSNGESSSVLMDIYNGAVSV